jgi:hypothetical protein
MRTLRILGILLGLVAELALYVVVGLLLTPVLLLLLFPSHTSRSRW